MLKQNFLQNLVNFASKMVKKWVFFSKMHTSRSNLKRGNGKRNGGKFRGKMKKSENYFLIPVAFLKIPFFFHT